MGPQGLQGPAGAACEPCVYLTIDTLEHEGQCLFVGDDVWVEHEGGKVDVYNNAQCDHDPDPNQSYCDNLTENKTCWAGTSRVDVVKNGSEWKVYKLNVAPDCAQQ